MTDQTKDPTNSGGDTESRSIEQIIAGYLDQLNSGESLNPKEILAEHPDYGNEILESLNEFIDLGVTSPDGPALDTLGDFKIIREIGRGGMATVYEAEQISLNRKVALKILPSHLTFSDQSVRKFYREAEAGGRQSHPGIVAIHAVSEHEGRHYIAQELVEGSYTLADKLNDLRKEKDLPIGYFREAAALIARVADALEHAHASKVIHRDIKPSNILLTKEGDPKVTDFGLAKVEDALSLSRTGDFSGTPYYMSPEQAQSRRIEINHRTDIYSLGVTLYEMLTLCRPFDGKTSHEVLKKIVSLEPSDPRKVNPRVPRDLAVICLKAMEKDPNRRYQTMVDFFADLQRFLQGETILAKPAGFGARVWKRVKRNPIVSVTSGAAVLAIVALILYVLWSYPQIIEERDKAVKASEEAERQRQAALEAKVEADDQREKAVEAGKEAERQREEALQAKAETEKEIEKTKAINEFLTMMFSSPDPLVDGREVKVVDVLEKVVGEIHDSFADQPELEVSVRTTVGNTYANLGVFGKAESQLRKALEICNKYFGDEHQDTLCAMSNLANLFMYQGKYFEAESLYRESLEKIPRVLGEDHPDSLIHMEGLASALKRQGKYPEAEALARAAINTHLRILGDDHPRMPRLMNVLACILDDQCKLSEAESLYQDILERVVEMNGENHPSTLTIKNNLAALFVKQGKYTEAELLLREILESSKVILGNEHPDMLSKMSNLASVLLLEGKYSEAELLIRKALEASKRTLGDDHPETISCIGKMASLLKHQGKYSEAESLLRKVLEVLKRTFGDDHPETLTCMSNLACVLDDEGVHAEAELLYRKVLDVYKRTIGDDHPDALRCMSNLACVLDDEGKHAEAELLYRKVLEVSRRTLGDDHPQTLSCMNNLACLIKDDEGKQAEAESLYRNVLEVSKQKQGDDHPHTLVCMYNLAYLLYKQGKYDEAESLDLDTLKVRRRIFGENHPKTKNVINNLIKLYDAWGKPEKAEEYRAMLGHKSNESPADEDSEE